MVSLQRMKIVASHAAALALILAATLPTTAQVVPDRGDLVLTGSASPNPAAAGGPVTYAFTVQNESTVTAQGVLVTVKVPPGPQILKCTPPVKNQLCTVDLQSGIVKTTFAIIKAHTSVKLSLQAMLPTVISGPSYDLVATAHADAAINGEEPRDGSVTLVGKVAADTIPVVFQPSGRTGTLSCNAIIGPGFFLPGESTVQFGASLGCAHSQTALKISVSDKTIDLKRYKIVGTAANLIPGSVGILVARGAARVTIIGGATNGSSGLEYFDTCLADEGGNDGLKVSSLRCFRARSAGIDVVSDNVELTGVLVDLVAAGASGTTADNPGGVGIHASGRTTIMDSVVRRAKTVGIWADGALDVNGNSHPTRIGGISRVEGASGIGIWFEGGGHEAKDVYVEGDGDDGLSTTGVLVNASEVSLDGLEVVQFGGNAFLVSGIGATIKRCSAEAVGGDSYVVTTTASGATLSGNTATNNLRGFVVAGANATLDTNRAEGTVGAAFVMSGDSAVMSGNSAKKAKGDAFVLSGNFGNYNTNLAESNDGAGFNIGGNSGSFKNNVSKSQKKGAGFLVQGTNNSFDTNIAERNNGSEWVIAPGNVNIAGNRKNGKTFTFGTAGGTFE